MSNAFCTFIHGCDAMHGEHPDRTPQFDTPEKTEVYEEVKALCEGAPHDIRTGFHSYYTGNGNILWWGAAYGIVGEVFSDIPSLGDAEKAEVLGEWDELPERIRNFLGPPKDQILMGVD